jgi:RNA polymerase sigma-70 factor (ECF subfamily)
MTEAGDRDYGEVARRVERARDGDDEAFRQLLDEHREVVVSTLIACGVRCPDTAGDLAQDVALKAWQNLDRINDPRSFRVWLRRIAANAARDHLRRRAVRREDELDLAVGLDSGDDPHQRAEHVAELRLMLAALEDEDDEVVALLTARAEGVPVESLAQRMGLTQGALKMRLMRARKRLRERLEALRAGRA